MPTICTDKHGKTLCQLWHIRKNKWVYIPFKKWLFMTDRQRNKYSID